MCIYYRQGIQQGDYSKTRIEYCDHAFNYVLGQRGGLPCHVPGDDSDHVIRCTPPEVFVKQHLTMNARRKLRDAQTLLARLHRAGVARERERISTLADHFIRLEERYRDLGCRYYAAGAWYQHMNPSVPSVMSLAVIGAFHYDTPFRHRDFFRPWLHLDLRIKDAMKALENGRVSPSTQVRQSRIMCNSAFKLVLAIRHSLDRLQFFIRSLEGLHTIIDNSGAGTYLRHHQRDTACWYWLRSLPETELALRAGKTKRTILQDALYPFDDQFCHRQIEMLTPRWPITDQNGVYASEVYLLLQSDSSDLRRGNENTPPGHAHPRSNRGQRRYHAHIADCNSEGEED